MYRGPPLTFDAIYLVNCSPTVYVITVNVLATQQISFKACMYLFLHCSALINSAQAVTAHFSPIFVLHYTTIDAEITNLSKVFPLPVLDPCTNEVVQSAFYLMCTSQ